LSLSDAGAPVIDHGVPAPLEAAWETIRTGLRRDCGARTFDGWLKPAELGGFDGDSGELEIVMPSQFMADWVRSHFGERLALAWRSLLRPMGPVPRPC
jgi:chromosomal replication initiator protein